MRLQPIILGLFISWLLLTTAKDFSNENKILLQDVFYPTDDATIFQNGPTKNAGQSEYLTVRNDVGGYPPPNGDGWARDVLIKFDLSSIPSNYIIKDAKLKLYYCEWWDNDPAGRTLSLYRVTSSWDEDTVTWENQPSYYNVETSSATVPLYTGKWMEWNVTNDVQGFVLKQLSNYGWRIRDEVPWGDVNIPIAYFYSKEYGSFTPYLEIKMEQDTNPPVVKIEKPIDAIYIFDRAILPFPFPFILGKITIEASAHDKLGVSEVEFYIDDVLKSADYDEPYEWLWDEKVSGIYTIKVMAYDLAGNAGFMEKEVAVFNLK